MTDHAQLGIENSGGPSDSEVPEKPVRRRFDTAYKQRIVEEADGCSQPGELGLLLRREGIYSSQLSTWRRQRDEGVLAGLTPISNWATGWKPIVRMVVLFFRFA